MFTSKSMRGFYAEDVHGPLTITVADPAWKQPSMSLTLEAGESYAFGDTLFTNESDEPKAVTVPDFSVMPATIEAPNPDTLIPADAVEISTEQWQALLDGQSNGQWIEWGEDGYPFLMDPLPPPPLTTEQTEAARLQAYADPLTGSDRHFAEAARLTVAGDTAGADAATVAGQTRYEEIRVELPWPVDDTQPTRSKKTTAKK